MLTRRSDTEWEAMAKSDPYYGVITLDEFRSDRMDADAKQRFFATGKAHIDFVLERIRQHLDADFSPKRGLDFGCGVGRCTIPMAGVCESVVGVDISNTMLEEARRNCDELAVHNADFVLSDDALSRVKGPIDFAHTFITFQHIPCRRGETILRAMFRALSPGGIAVVHLLHHRDVPRIVKVLGGLRKRVPLFHNLMNLVAGKPYGEPLVEKNCYNLNRVMRLLAEEGCGGVHLMFEDEPPLHSVVLFAQKGEDRFPYEQFYNQARNASAS